MLMCCELRCLLAGCKAKCITENNRTQLVIFGIRNRIFGPYLAVLHRITDSSNRVARGHTSVLGLSWK
jgi:hypothetical protein